MTPRHHSAEPRTQRAPRRGLLPLLLAGLLAAATPATAQQPGHPPLSPLTGELNARLVTTLEQQGLQAMAAGELEQARRLFNQLQARMQHHPEAAYYLGVLALAQGAYDQAASQWRHYLALSPRQARQRGIPRRLRQVEQTLETMALIIALEALHNPTRMPPPQPGRVVLFDLQAEGEDTPPALAAGLSDLLNGDLSRAPGLSVTSRETTRRLLIELALMRPELTEAERHALAARLLGAQWRVEGWLRLATPPATTPVPKAAPAQPVAASTPVPKAAPTQPVAASTPASKAAPAQPVAASTPVPKAAPAPAHPEAE